LLRDHLNRSSPSLDGTAYLNMARSVGVERLQAAVPEIRDVVFFTPMILSEGEERIAETVLTRKGDGIEMRVRSQVGVNENGPQWQDHAVATVLAGATAPPPPVRIDEVVARCERVIEKVDIDRLLTSINQNDQHPLTFGPRWFNLQRVYVGQDEGIATIELPVEMAADLDEFALHPAMLDIATSFYYSFVARGFYLPLAYDRLRVYGPLERRVWSHARFRTDQSSGGETLRIDLTVAADDGRVLVEIEGCTLKRAGAGTVPRARAAGEMPAMPAGGSNAALDAGMTVAEGLDALGRVLASRLAPQTAVSVNNLPARLQLARTVTQTKLVAGLARRSEGMRATHARPDAMSTTYEPPSNDIERAIAETWQAALGIEKVGIYDKFLEIGGNSLIAVQIRNRIQEVLEVDLPVDVMFTSPTIADLARTVLEIVTSDAAEQHTVN
jgi:hypothetical protein